MRTPKEIRERQKRLKEQIEIAQNNCKAKTIESIVLHQNHINKLHSEHSLLRWALNEEETP